MIHLNLDPTPVAAGETVALTPEASITSLGEVRVGRRRFQARRTVDAKWGHEHYYLLDTRGNAWYVEAPDRLGRRRAPSRDTGSALTSAARPGRFVTDADSISVFSAA